MQNFVAARGRSITIVTVLVTLLFGINLFLHGKLYLLGAVICGYGAALYYAIMLVLRLKKAMFQSKARAKSSIRLGMLLRIIVLLAAMYLAMRLSVEIFWCFVLGFFFFHLVLFINFIIFSWQEKIH